MPDIVAVRRQTPRSVTMTLEPNRVFTGFRAGQHINCRVEIDGRRRTRCYSPANAEGSALIELTIGRTTAVWSRRYLCDARRPGMVVGLDSVGGDFVLPGAAAPRILFVSGGSGITPVLSMLRTLHAEGFAGEIAFVHYARSADEACYRDELDGDARRSGAARLHPRHRRRPIWTDASRPAHLAAAMAEPEAVFVCGPPALIEAVRGAFAAARSRRASSRRMFAAPTDTAGGSISFTASGVEVVDDGQTLLDQAEAAGLQPGERMPDGHLPQLHPASRSAVRCAT